MSEVNVVHNETVERKIIHVDMDAFFAAIEQRDRPELRGKPVIVGGSPHRRGVVATCSYEARTYGIHSAMPSLTAVRLCPHAVFIQPNMQKYKETSTEIMDIFRSYTDLVEPLALDEAYLDVTVNKTGMKSATLLAQQIKKAIYERTGLTASAGVSYNKFIAKIASGYKKPDGLTVIPPNRAKAFIDAIPIGDFFGVGKVTEERLLALGIKNGKDLREYTRDELVEAFQSRGNQLYEHVRGIDERPVEANRKRKSLGKEKTLIHNVAHVDDMLPILSELCAHVSEQLQRHRVLTSVITIKVKYANFKQITRRTTLSQPTNEGRMIEQTAHELLQNTALEGKEVRLLGVHTSDFYAEGDDEVTHFETKPYYVQLELFPHI